MNVCYSLFTEKCTASDVQADILKNLSNHHVLHELKCLANCVKLITVQLCHEHKCLAVVGKSITGPWMTEFYAKSVRNLEMFRSIQNYVEQLEAWMDDRKSILSLEKDILGKVIVGDSMTEAIRADLTETAARIIQRLLSAVITFSRDNSSPF